jgi:hypothetical protein
MEKDYSGGPWARPVRNAFFLMLLLVVLCCVGAVFTDHPPPKPLTPEEQRARQAAEKDRQQIEQAKQVKQQVKQDLCRAAAVCKKYDTVRLECATAGSFKTCLRVKMGDDSVFANSCNGYSEGGPALPPPPGTPNVVECFFLTMSR